jgi:hypothetical protein
VTWLERAFGRGPPRGDLGAAADVAGGAAPPPRLDPNAGRPDLLSTHPRVVPMLPFRFYPFTFVLPATTVVTSGRVLPRSGVGYPSSGVYLSVGASHDG